MPHRKYGAQTMICRSMPTAMMAGSVEKSERSCGPNTQESRPQHHAEEHRPEYADLDRRDDAARLACAGILPGEAGDRLLECVHRLIDEVGYVRGGCVARDDDGAEAVDRGLDDHVGQREDRGLNARRLADADDLAQLAGVQAQAAEGQARRSLHAEQRACDQQRRNRLGEDRRQRDARHAQMEEDDEDEVEHDVHDTGDGHSGRCVSPTARRIAEQKL